MNHEPPTLQSSTPTLNLAGDLDASNLALVPCPAQGSQVPALHAVSIQPVVTVSPPAPPILKGRPRTGAVASLPKDERDMACRMIANDVPYKKIAEALDKLGYQVTERNISNWVTHGGYAEWCTLSEEAVQTSLRQDDLLEHHRSENSPDLAEVGLQAAAVRLSELLLRQTASNQDVETNLSKLQPVVHLLCRINKELFTAQKYRDDCLTNIYRPPARAKAKEREKLAVTEYYFSADPEKLKLKAPGADTAKGSPAAPTNAAAQRPAAPTPAPAQPTPAAVSDESALDSPSPATGSSPETATAPPVDSPAPPTAASSGPPTP